MKAAQLDTRQLWYTASNEDSRSEVCALRPQGRRILSITASGSRSFDLLIEDPASIVSVDQNPAQTALAELLAAAYRRLDYAQFRRLVGLDPAEDRFQLWRALAIDLPDDARHFWEGQAKLIERGIIYGGKWEGYLRSIRRLAGPGRRKLAARLLAAPTIEAQHALWRDHWDDRAWRLFLRLLSVRFLWTHVAREPGIAFVAPDFDISGYVRGRFDHVARHQKLSDSPFAWLMLAGGYPRDTLPPYLSEAGFDLIKARIDRVRFVTAPVQHLLAQTPADAFDAASLSDYSSYCDVEVQRGLWTDLSRVMAPGGRVCERKFFNKSGTELPEALGFDRDRALEERLFAEDRAFFYSFVVAGKSG